MYLLIYTQEGNYAPQLITRFGDFIVSSSPNFLIELSEILDAKSLSDRKIQGYPYPLSLPCTF